MSDASMVSARAAVGEIEQRTQTQASLDDQLELLYVAANRLGLYDAADLMKRLKSKETTTDCPACEEQFRALKGALSSETKEHRILDVYHYILTGEHYTLCGKVANHTFGRVVDG